MYLFFESHVLWRHTAVLDGGDSLLWWRAARGQSRSQSHLIRPELGVHAFRVIQGTLPIQHSNDQA